MKKEVDNDMDVFSEIPNQYLMNFQFSIDDESLKVLTPHMPLAVARGGN